MEYTRKVKPGRSHTMTNSPSSQSSTSTPLNPYARDPSRRAIACVTCAKAKTRCDKALPSCSRCITKGIRCDPRSTRRTTDNNYRSLPTKRTFVTPQRLSAPGLLPSSNSFPSPRSIPSTKPRSIMRAPSHIDFRTAVKMSQQAAVMSSVPKLTPLPTYQSRIVDECYSYTPSPEPELRYTPEIEQDGFPFSRGATPQTPGEPFGYNDFDLIPTSDDIDYLGAQPWSNDGLGLGVGNIDMVLPDDSWMRREPFEMPQANVFAQNAEMQGAFDVSLSGMPEDWSAFPFPTPDTTSLDDKMVDPGLDSGIVMQGEWAHPLSPRQDMFVDMGNLITSAPYVPKMQAIPGHAPVWQDVFMPSTLPY